MSTNSWMIAGAGLSLLFVFLSGFRLSHAKKPYNSIVLAVHKLLSLAAVVFLFFTIYQRHQVAPLNATELILSVVTGLLFLGTIVVGGLLSTGKPRPVILLSLHRITPFLSVLFNAVTLYLLVSRN